MKISSIYNKFNLIKIDIQKMKVSLIKFIINSRFKNR